MTTTVPRPAFDAVEVKDAATVVLVRDGDRGPEVAMLRRRLESGFVPGAYVFPGGAVDAEDRDPRWANRCVGHDDTSASAVLGTVAGGLAYWVAAIRECFEEAGLFLAHRAGGRALDLTPDGGADADRFDEHRRRVDDGHTALFDVVEGEDLHLPVGDLHYFARWITPELAPRRYDTRFFVGRAPDDQVLRHDGDETIAALWVRPADALARNTAGDFELIRPTQHSLEILSHYPDADAVLAAAAAGSVGMERPT